MVSEELESNASNSIDRYVVIADAHTKFAGDRSMEEKTSKQLETSPTLERKRAKYTVEDVRQLCGGISRSTVMREIRRKRLACYRARKTLRFSEEHITKYLERVEQEVK